MKHVVSVVGARPNFMKIAPIDRALNRYSDFITHSIVHTGQHYDSAMSDAFFHDLDIRQPKWFLGVGSGSHASQTAAVMKGFESICLREQPHLVIVAGDVNSTIGAALTSVKCGIRTAHVEAGLRSFDRTMPEEINRIATDAIVDDFFVTEQSGVDNLIREGVNSSRIHYVGNTMIDSLLRVSPLADNATILKELHLEPKSYALVTLHRPSNVDDASQLSMFIELLNHVAKSLRVVFPLHPRTKASLEHEKLAPLHPSVLCLDPLGYINFVALMKHSALVITDSGGIQEETTALRIPCITARTTTERPVTVQMGTNTLVQPHLEALQAAVDSVISAPAVKGQIPHLWDGNAADRIADVIAMKIFGLPAKSNS